MTNDQRPAGLAADAVWPTRAHARQRVVIVNPGVTVTRDPDVAHTEARDDVLMRPLEDVRSGLVDPDVGVVPPAPDTTHRAPAPAAQATRKPQRPVPPKRKEPRR